MYRSHFFPPNVVPKSGCDLYMLLDFFQVWKCLQIERKLSRTPIFQTSCLWLCNGEIITKRSNSVFLVNVKIAHCKIICLQGVLSTLARSWRGFCPPLQNHEGGLVQSRKTMKGILSTCANLSEGDYVRRFFVRIPLIHAIGAFCQYFPPISGVRLIHTCELYTGVYGTWRVTCN